ncbi:apolipoprotein N-acyltransferase [Streptomyces europaeiscabiei]|uniref:Apolipoprotein N-acyltransferase n=1 Tax=Streptomyces europaeiscabiei TaxID=146819 RepID=A0ABU4NT68_9ACTN|nr:apolipoprotein N-acyltransferase [Streptomyces europaeiscabiei]MDX2530509.1 apolipoprotein N-acyltransferase [Streptomyces europaeiscabiei]MDX2761867.1 apolipoprotein N-acyltransferase [Streptomyces europaeiscabiei]MDX2773106.1 apolipoprotein N-acyltransferase [Streptomyces europaeiscabiei]MDX3548412.1 apolipoprotein N-acyltransferase [Streptomyces europaeiscabiei]MDX3552606.1 apolipoprotein N-acyltransferase [Streptomyces europaeiscabiei]
MTVTATPVDEPEQLEPQAAPVSRVSRWVGRLLPAAAATLSGVLLYVSFPPRTLWWLALPAFAVFGWVLRGRGWKAGLGLGYLFGLGFLLPLLVWTGVEVGPGPWLALVVIEAVFVALVGAGVAVVSKLPGWPVWAAALWVAGEAARARAPFSGFPWGKIAFGQADGVFLPLAALGGTPVLGFAVVLCGFGLYELVRLVVENRRTGAAVRRGTAAVAALSVAVPLAGALASRALVSDEAEDGTATVAVIQGNVPRLGLDFNAQRRAVLDYHAKETERLAAEVKAGKVDRPDFVLWPENSSDIDPFANPDARAVIDKAAAAIGAPISVGGVVERDGRLYNEQILWDPEKGPVDTYDKRQIQPFGEYLPLRSLIGAINSEWTSMVRKDFSRGSQPGVFTMDGAKVGLVTCYEAAFDWAVRSEVTDGAQLISVPSNNATFDRSEMTYQQLAMSRVRAVEHSRTVTVPVTSGVSAIIMPDGRITQKTGMFVPDSLVQKVPLRSSETPATRLGIAPEMLLVLVAAGGLGWAIGAGVRGRRAGGV